MTERETTLYEAMKSGDWDSITELQVAAQEAGDTDFEADYLNAWIHYQADHDMPEEERADAMASLVEAENSNVEEGAKVADEV
jgi:hypothetical protein